MRDGGRLEDNAIATALRALFGRGSSTAVDDASRRRRAESLSFIAAQIDGSVQEQLATADALDVKIGGLLALSVATALGYLAVVAPEHAHFEVLDAAGGGLAIGYAFGAAVEALRAFRPDAYQRWPDPTEYIRLVRANVIYDTGDLAEQAALEKTRAHDWNRNELEKKAARLRWTLAFVAGQLLTTLLSAIAAVRL